MQPREIDVASRALCVVAWLLVQPGCKKHDEPAHHARPVKVHTVAARSADSGLRYSASLHPREEIQVAFKVGGYVSEIQQRRGTDGRQRHLQQGDIVRRGTVLAKLRDSDMAEQVHSARAQHAESEAGLVKATYDMRRAERLYESKSLTRPEFDTATAALASAQARVDAAAARLRSAEIGFEDCALVAPLDGIILSRSVEVGTLASPGMVAFALADVSRLEAVFGVPSREITHLQMGDSLPVSIEGQRPFTAQITALSPSADTDSRAFRVEVAIPNQDGRLRTGMIATVMVPRGGRKREPKPSMAVPLGAVVRSGQQADTYAVFVLEGNGSEAVARQRAVRLGPISGNDVTVESGLEPGDRVVAMGATLVQDGEAVRIIP